MDPARKGYTIVFKFLRLLFENVLLHFIDNIRTNFQGYILDVMKFLKIQNNKKFQVLTSKEDIATYLNLRENP